MQEITDVSPTLDASVSSLFEKRVIGLGRQKQQDRRSQGETDRNVKLNIQAYDPTAEIEAEIDNYLKIWQVVNEVFIDIL